MWLVKDALVPADPSVGMGEGRVTVGTWSKNTTVRASQYHPVSWVRNKPLQYRAF